MIRMVAVHRAACFVGKRMECGRLEVNVLHPAVRATSQHACRTFWGRLGMITERSGTWKQVTLHSYSRTPPFGHEDIFYLSNALEKPVLEGSGCRYLDRMLVSSRWAASIAPDFVDFHAFMHRRSVKLLASRTRPTSQRCDVMSGRKF